MNYQIVEKTQMNESPKKQDLIGNWQCKVMSKHIYKIIAGRYAPSGLLVSVSPKTRKHIKLKYHYISRQQQPKTQRLIRQTNTC